MITLPTKSPRLITAPRKLKYLLIAPPKWGKTTFIAGCPNAVLLAFEAGYAGAECPVIVMTDWDRPYKEKAKGWREDENGVVYTSAIEAIEELEKACPYEMIILDTADQMVKMASDHHCAAAKVEHPSDGGDYGRGYDILQTSPVRRFYMRLVKLGVGVAAITHAKERSERDKFGQERFRRETSLPTGIQSFIHAQSDVIMHGFFGRRRRGKSERDRVISFDPTNEIMAGTRLRQVKLPNKYIVAPPSVEDLALPWKQWEGFFADSPQAGLNAEAEFYKLAEGMDDESTLAPAPKVISTTTTTQQGK
jgi:AAA domain-containing protein